MSELLPPKEARSTYDVYAKPVVMSQPEETRVKQRQRLLSDELTKRAQPDTRPSTPPGKLKISKISNMLQRSSTGETGKTSRDKPSSRPPSRRQSPEMHSAKEHCVNAQIPVQASLRPTSGSNRWKEVAPKPAPAHQPNGSAHIVAEAIAQFEGRIGQKEQGRSASKQNGQPSPAAEGERPLSHRSSQRAEALRQLRELWLSDEAEQPGTPDLPSASEAPSPLHAATDSCNSHSRASPSAQLEQPEKRKAKEQQERGPSLPSRAQEAGSPGIHEEDSSSSSGMASKIRHLNEASSVDGAVSPQGHAQGTAAGAYRNLEAGHHSESIPASTQLQHLPNGHAEPVQSSERPQHENRAASAAAEALPVSSPAERGSSGDIPHLVDRNAMSAAVESQLAERLKGSASCDSGPVSSGQTRAACAVEPAWVAGFRDDISQAMDTPFMHPAEQLGNPPEFSSPGESPVRASHAVHQKLLFQAAAAKGKGTTSGSKTLPVSTPDRSPGLGQQSSALPIPLRSSASRIGLMQGWRSIMHGSPQQGSGARMSAVAAHKNGLDLAWRLNEVVHELSSCLARTAEQQQLLTDAARLLAHGEEEDTGYAAEKLQAADELRQWSEAAQCSSIACLVGILKELQHSRQARLEEVHFNPSAWLAILGPKGQ